MRFFDASALVKRYVREPGSIIVGRLMRDPGATVSRWSSLEVASALHRRAREGALAPGDVERALTALDADLAAFQIVEVTGDVITRARELMSRYPPRAGDSVQLAACLDFGERIGAALTMVAFDHRLREAASGAGLALLPRRLPPAVASLDRRTSR